MLTVCGVFAWVVASVWELLPKQGLLLVLVLVFVGEYLSADFVQFHVVKVRLICVLIWPYMTSSWKKCSQVSQPGNMKLGKCYLWLLWRVLISVIELSNNASQTFSASVFFLYSYGTVASLFIFSFASSVCVLFAVICSDTHIFSNSVILSVIPSTNSNTCVRESKAVFNPSCFRAGLYYQCRDQKWVKLAQLCQRGLCR